jgi:rhamnulokinase
MVKNVLAIDLGASSGRAIVGSYEKGTLKIFEVHRFANEPVENEQGLFWNFPRIFDEVKKGIKKAADEFELSSFAIDTWGVDFGLLDADGKLINLPFHYRNSLFKGSAKSLYDVISREKLFSLTGIAEHDYNTLSQLHAMVKDGNEALGNAESLLFIPDLLLYFLTGVKQTEHTIASTSQLIYADKPAFIPELLNSFRINEKLFSSSVTLPGAVTGKIKPEIEKEMGLKYHLNAVACAQHDTASAVLAAPITEGGAYISSGTWSLLGAELDSPVLVKEALEKGYTNEAGFGRKIRFLKNIMGLWIIQECRREWGTISFAQIAEEAAKAKPFKCFIDPDAPEFFAPSDMTQKIKDYCEKTGQEKPEGIGEIARTVFESLAFKYRESLEDLGGILNKKFNALSVVGGGSNNDLFNALTASACGVTVTAGPSEATAIGNIACQLIALKEIEDSSQARQIVKSSFACRVFKPENTDIFSKNYKKYKNVTKL